MLPADQSMCVDEESYRRNQTRRMVKIGEPGDYLYEPDPAVIRAGLVQDLGVRLDAFQVDKDIAYLTGDLAVQTSFARLWPVEAWFPFGLKRLRTELRVRDVGSITVKKRGSPLEPSDLIRRLRLKGEQSRVIFLTHFQGKPICIICFSEITNREHGLR